MRTLSCYRLPGTSFTTWTTYNGQKFETYGSEDIPCVLSDLLKTTKDAEHIYINNFNMYFFDFVSSLWRAGFTPIKGNPSVKKMHEKQFKYLVNGEMNVYSITVKIHKRAVVLVNYDNIVSISYNDVIETWTTEEEGTRPERLALSMYRSIKMLNADCGVEKQFPVTISGYARRKWKSLVGFWNVSNRLPDANKVKIDGETLESYCRKAYHGGLNITRNAALGSEIIDLEGYVLDANSLYPFCMKNFYYPVKEPKVLKGEPDARTWRECHNGFTYMYLRVKVALRLKKGGIPCVQLPARDKQCFTHKRGWIESTQYFNYHTQEYVPESEEDPNLVELTLTQTDFELMAENYDILKIEYINHVIFLTTKELFEDYVDEYYKKKSNATTPGEKRISKMMLNGLSGSMARLPEYTNLQIEIDDDGRIKVEENVTQGGQSWVYIGAAITSYGRKYLIDHAKKCGSLWLYSDTDSVHLIGQNIPSFFKIGDGLGEWKIEKEWDQVIYYKAKMYGMIKDGKAHLTLAGVPRDNVRFLERLMTNPTEYSYDGLDIEMPNIFNEEENDNDDDYVAPPDKDIKRFETLEADIREMGLKALCYTSFPITIKKHSDTEFEEHLTTQYSNLSDKGFL